MGSSPTRVGFRIFRIDVSRHSYRVNQAVPHGVEAGPEEGQARSREKFTSVAHRHHVFCSPMGEEKAEELLTCLRLRSGDRILDVGCGKAELLIRMAERFGVAGVGIDRSPVFLAEARSGSQRLDGPGTVTFLEQDAASYTPAGELFDVGICIGGGAGYGFFPKVLERMAGLVKRDRGVLVIGECYWKQPPAREYLEFLGIESGAYLSHEGNLELCAKRGLAVEWHSVSSLQEWDDYEDLYARSIREYALANPGDPDVPAMMRRIESWQGMYEAHGRNTLGFGFYILEQAPGRAI
jgi:SAM-dependent methyltransferase